ncbi:MAG: cytochrome b [Proteobacteria bacterium]|nr:cytochrome b [Pseudomonadota bacterium]
MLRNSHTSWGWLSRGLHWSMAALLLSQIVLGKYAHELDRTPEKLKLMMLHKSFGISLLLLLLIRIVWTLFNVKPRPVLGTTRVQAISVWLSHASLYLLMFAIPLSGWLMNSAKNIPFSMFRSIKMPALIGPDEQLAEVFAELHETLVAGFLVILVIHVLAALWHHFFKRDSVLRRMSVGET